MADEILVGPWSAEFSIPDDILYSKTPIAIKTSTQIVQTTSDRYKGKTKPLYPKKSGKARKASILYHSMFEKQLQPNVLYYIAKDKDKDKYKRPLSQARVKRFQAQRPESI
jgi:hypothetical protein